MPLVGQWHGWGVGLEETLKERVIMRKFRKNIKLRKILAGVLTCYFAIIGTMGSYRTGAVEKSEAKIYKDWKKEYEGYNQESIAAAKVRFDNWKNIEYRWKYGRDTDKI